MGWDGLHTILSVPLTRTFLSLHPNYTSRLSSPGSLPRWSRWALIILSYWAWGSKSCSYSGLDLFSTLARYLSLTPHPNLAYFCPIYDLKPLRTAPLIRISLVIAHLFHLLNCFLSPYWVSDIRNTEAGKTLSLRSRSFFSTFFFFLTSLWSIIALQWCVSFCFITKWISYTYTYVPISLPSCISLPPTLPT